jgi:hypothetical protein
MSLRAHNLCLSPFSLLPHGTCSEPSLLPWQPPSWSFPPPCYEIHQRLIYCLRGVEQASDLVITAFFCHSQPGSADSGCEQCHVRRLRATADLDIVIALLRDTRAAMRISVVATKGECSSAAEADWTAADSSAGGGRRLAARALSLGRPSTAQGSGTSGVGTPASQARAVLAHTPQGSVRWHPRWTIRPCAGRALPPPAQCG